jgi:hypothetical protein
MTRFAVFFFALIAGAAVALGVRTHTLDELEGQLTKQEKYFQPMKPGPRRASRCRTATASRAA